MLATNKYRYRRGRDKKKALSVEQSAFSLRLLVHYRQNHHQTCF